MATRAKAAPVRERISEAQLQAAVVEYAQRLGWKVFFVPDWMYRLALQSMSRNRRGDRVWSSGGFPDLVLMQGLADKRTPVRLIFAELKVDKGVFSSAEQYDWVAGLRRVAGIETYVFKVRDYFPRDGESMSNIEKILLNGPMPDHDTTRDMLARKRPAERVK